MAVNICWYIIVNEDITTLPQLPNFTFSLCPMKTQFNLSAPFLRDTSAKESRGKNWKNGNGEEYIRHDQWELGIYFYKKSRMVIGGYIL